MIFEQQLRRIMHFLRDPSYDIFSRDLVTDIFNDVQQDLQVRTGVLEDVAVLRHAPRYQWAVTYDWELAYVPAGETVRLCLRRHPQTGAAYCYAWEAQQVQGIAGDIADTGVQFTQLWEAWTIGDPGQAVPIPFPTNHRSTKLIAYDQLPLEYEDKRLIMERDNTFLSTEGQPVAYYREGQLDKTFIPYPRPPIVDQQDIESDPPRPRPAVFYTHEFEKDNNHVKLIGDDGAINTTPDSKRFGFFDSTTKRQHVFRWELGGSDGRDDMIRSMWGFEHEQRPDQYGGVVAVSTDTVIENDDRGTFIKREGSLVSSELGITVDVLDEDDAYLLIYDIEPDDVDDGTDESNFPPFLQKYIEHGTLARAYGANTDGRIRSLADYWRLRYQFGLEIIKRYRTSRTSSRNYRLRTQGVTPIRQTRHPRLPSSYPSI